MLCDMKVWLHVMLTLGLVAIGGCSRANRPVTVEYVFSNVSVSPVNEWPEIETVLRAHAVQEQTDTDVEEDEVGEGREPVLNIRRSTVASHQGAEFQQVSATFVVPSARTIGEIDEAIFKLGRRGSWLERQLGNTGRRATHNFTLQRARIAYESGFVTSAINVTLTGVTTAYAEVLVFTSRGDRTPTLARADAGGRWVVRLDAVPESREVFGYARSRSGGYEYFKINVSTMEHTDLSADEFPSGLRPGG